MSDRIRTGDRLDHNQELYQLSYAHRALSNVPGDAGRPLGEVRLRRVSASRIHARKAQEVHHPKAAAGGSELRLPFRLCRQMGRGIRLHETDQHLADDSASDRPEVEASRLELRFL